MHQSYIIVYNKCFVAYDQVRDHKVHEQVLGHEEIQ